MSVAVGVTLAICPVCRDVAAAPGEPCPSCARETEAIALPETGRLYASTTVFRAPAGTPVPFRLGYADFDPDVRLFARLPIDAELAVGDPVRVVLDDRDGFRLIAATAQDAP
jgi:uncharacterized OB-fold protein